MQDISNDLRMEILSYEEDTCWFNQAIVGGSVHLVTDIGRSLVHLDRTATVLVYPYVRGALGGSWRPLRQPIDFWRRLIIVADNKKIQEWVFACTRRDMSYISIRSYIELSEEEKTDIYAKRARVSIRPGA